MTSAKRSAATVAIIVVLAFLGVSAFAGKPVLLVPSLNPPADWLDDVPVISSWILPGLVLGLVFGVGSLVTAWGAWKRPRPSWLRGIERWTGRHWSWAAGLALGVGQIVWISLELAFLPEVSFLQPLYGAVGLTLCVLALLPSVRRDFLLRN